MFEEESIPAVVERPFAPRTYLAMLPVWKKTMIAGAVMMLVAAVVTIFVEDPVEKVTDLGGLPSTLDAGQDPKAIENGPEALTPWSEAFFKFGFSFFVGFSVGYATRAFLKLVLFLIGGLAICLFLLSYFEFVEVKWQALDDAFTQFGGLFRGQFEKFRTFITGSLPNAALAGLGLFTGFKKNR
jgi:uncharacterized membrane protein (Fun14 family)